MNEVTKEYLKLIAEYEEKVFGYSEKIAFRDALAEIINKHGNALTTDELCCAQKLFNRLQKEIYNG
jgi:hypothetical protein